MEDRLAEIQGWANRGNLRQFHAEVEAKLTGTDYAVEQENGTLRFYRVTKEGGFLGIGVRQKKDLVLEVSSEDSVNRVVEQDADQEFVEFLARLLEQH